MLESQSHELVNAVRHLHLRLHPGARPFSANDSVADIVAQISKDDSSKSPPKSLSSLTTESQGDSEPPRKRKRKSLPPMDSTSSTEASSEHRVITGDFPSAESSIQLSFLDYGYADSSALESGPANNLEYTTRPGPVFAEQSLTIGNFSLGEGSCTLPVHSNGYADPNALPSCPATDFDHTTTADSNAMCTPGPWAGYDLQASDFDDYLDHVILNGDWSVNADALT